MTCLSTIFHPIKATIYKKDNNELIMNSLRQFILPSLLNILRKHNIMENASKRNIWGPLLYPKLRDPVMNK